MLWTHLMGWMEKNRIEGRSRGGKSGEMWIHGLRGTGIGGDAGGIEFLTRSFPIPVMYLVPLEYYSLHTPQFASKWISDCYEVVESEYDELGEACD